MSSFFLSHDCASSLVAAPSPSLTPVHKSQPCIGLKGRGTIHCFKSFLKHAASSQRPCNYPLRPISLLSIVICSASIRTSVCCLFTPYSLILSYLPSHLLQHNEEHGTRTAMHATRFRDQITSALTFITELSSLCVYSIYVASNYLLIFLLVKKNGSITFLFNLAAVHPINPKPLQHEWPKY